MVFLHRQQGAPQCVVAHCPLVSKMTYLSLLTPHVEILALCLREMVPGLLLTGNREYFLDLLDFNRKTRIRMLHCEHESRAGGSTAWGASG